MKAVGTTFFAAIAFAIVTFGGIVDAPVSPDRVGVGLHQVLAGSNEGRTVSLGRVQVRVAKTDMTTLTR